MIKLTKNLARQWARIGPRGIYGLSLLNFAEINPSIFAISADLGNSSGLDRFKKTLPRRFKNIGIAEQNMIGFSSGLSTCGFNVFASSFAPFLSLRSGEQVRMNLSYMQSNVKIVAIGSGISMGFLGNSHFGLEDISIIRSMPNILIINPCDCFEVYKSVEALTNYDGPAYLRLTGAAPCPIVHNEDYKFELGKSYSLLKGEEILILTYGSMVKNSLTAANKLIENHGLSIRLENIHTLRPIDKKIKRLVNNFEKIFVIEEHSLIGGLSTIVSEIISNSSKNPKVFKSLCLPPSFLKSGTYDELLKKYSLTAEKIYEIIFNSLDNS